MKYWFTELQEFRYDEERTIAVEKRKKGFQIKKQENKINVKKKGENVF